MFFHLLNDFNVIYLINQSFFIIHSWILIIIIIITIYYFKNKHHAAMQLKLKRDWPTQSQATSWRPISNQFCFSRQLVCCSLLCYTCQITKRSFARLVCDSVILVAKPCEEGKLTVGVKVQSDLKYFSCICCYGNAFCIISQKNNERGGGANKLVNP